MAIFTNRATVTYGGNQISSNTAQGEIIDPLSVRKYAINDSYSADGLITYVAVIANSSDTAMSAVSFTDDLGAYAFGGGTVYPLNYSENSIRYFSDGTLQTPPAVTSANGLSVTGLTVPANGEVMLIYQAQANSYAPLGTQGEITNTAYATSASGTQTESASATVSADASPQLSVNKSISPVPVTDGGTVTYTFVIQNTGATAADDVVLSDLFDPLLSDITVTYNGTPWTGTDNYTYNETSGQFDTRSGSITVPAAEVTQNTATGEWSVTPSTVTLTVSGTV